METKVSCKFCASRCRMLIVHKGNKINKISGDQNHPVSLGWTCARGRAATAIYCKDKLESSEKADSF